MKTQNMLPQPPKEKSANMPWKVQQPLGAQRERSAIAESKALDSRFKHHARSLQQQTIYTHPTDRANAFSNKDMAQADALNPNVVEEDILRSVAEIEDSAGSTGSVSPFYDYHYHSCPYSRARAASKNSCFAARKNIATQPNKTVAFRTLTFHGPAL